jgi:hypothetical protein
MVTMPTLPGPYTQSRGFTQPKRDETGGPIFRSEEYLAGLVREVVPDGAEILRYWPAHKAPPAGWKDAASMGAHHWRGKIIVRVSE